MKKIITYAIVFLLTFTLIFDTSYTHAESNLTTVDAKTLNMRAGPGLSFGVITSLNKGDQVEIISVSGDWLEVQFNGEKGWIASWLTVSTQARNETSNTQIVSQVNTLNVRSSPSIDAAVLGRMNAGDEATLIKRDGDWAYINLNGMNGWVHTDYISEISTKQKNDDSKAPATQKAQTFTVGVDALNVRKKADLSSKRLKVIHKNETYPIKEVVDNWVRIDIGKNKDGWVYSFHGTLSSNSNKQASTDSPTTSNTATVLANGTNIRESATTSSSIVKRANAGEQFTIKREVDDWFEITLSNGKTAFIAKWVVSVGDNQITDTPVVKKQPRVPGTLKGLTIVLDPGHGGNDRGTTGVRNTFEKSLTLKTAELLATKLKAAGATVHLTRESDEYIALRKRVAISHQYEADAFLSIHYDSTTDMSISGFTTYYTYSRQAELAQAITNGLDGTLSLRNRGAQPGDYFVLRENRQNAVLIELGFLSNPSEERAVKSASFREQATHGIYNGILDYFNSTIN